VYFDAFAAESATEAAWLPLQVHATLLRN